MPIIGGLIALVVFCLILYHGIGETYASVGVWLWIAPIALIAGFFALLFLPSKLKDMKTYAAAPDDGPMKIDITSEQIQAPSNKHRLEGGEHWWRMHINIQLSKSDMDLFNQSGLMENELFAYPHPKFPDMMASFAGLSIGYVKYADFPSTQALAKAKEDLFDGLRAVRLHLESMKHGGTDLHKESLEI